EQGLDRVGDKILDADHGVKGPRYAAAKPPLTPWSASKQESHAIQAEPPILHIHWNNHHHRGLIGAPSPAFIITRAPTVSGEGSGPISRLGLWRTGHRISFFARRARKLSDFASPHLDPR